jgi:hypothetical protein
MSSAYDKVEAFLKPVKDEKPLQASLEDLTTFAFLIPLGAIYLNDREAVNDLKNVPHNTGDAKVPESPFTQLLVLIAFVLSVLRIVAHRFYNSHPWLDLGFSLAVWGVFLTVWILSNNTITKINALKLIPTPTPAPNSLDDMKNKIITSAATSVTRERDWAVLGFILSSLYTAYCAFTIKDDLEGLMSPSDAADAAVPK